MKIERILLVCMLMVGGLACEKNALLDGPQPLDYAEVFSWAARPDSVEKSVDVFYVYPTLFGGTGEMNMDITDDAMRQRVLDVLPKQCGVFGDHCNVYAPYYRQMAMDGLMLDGAERNGYFSIGAADIERAFEYYIAHLNQGRPFILAGHSQGAEVLIALMKDAFHRPELMGKLVAAYLIGYSVTNEDLAACSWLKIAQSADDVGVIITYNTQSEHATGSPVLLPGARCVNPLNWTSGSEYAPKNLHRGAVFFKADGSVDSVAAEFTDAWIDENGALVAGTPDIDDYSSPGFPRGVYHKYDYSFFFNNLKENVGVRVEAYWDAK